MNEADEYLNKVDIMARADLYKIIEFFCWCTAYWPAEQQANHCLQTADFCLLCVLHLQASDSGLFFKTKILIYLKICLFLSGSSLLALFQFPPLLMLMIIFTLSIKFCVDTCRIWLITVLDETEPPSKDPHYMQSLRHKNINK